MTSAASPRPDSRQPDYRHPDSPHRPAPAPRTGEAGIAPRTALAMLAALLVTAPACLVAVYLSPRSIRPEIAWGSGAAGLALCLAVGTAAWQLLTNRRLRDRLAAQRAETAALRDSSRRFAAETVPALVARLRDGTSADTALASVRPAPDDAAQRGVLRTLAEEVHRSETARAAALTACANAAGRVQALTTGMATDLRDMEHRHGDPDVLGDLLHLDHRTAQAGRQADCIAVLTGAPPGQHWADPIVMESILRGAMGRISAYRRVRLHSTSTAAVVGQAAEGVMHALAELLDNAANFSPPTAEVHVYVEEVAAGVVVTVEDGGTAMSEAALRHAEEAVNSRSTELSTRSGTRLGLAVVGRLARRHGLSVSFRPSAHGGTGALLRIPPELITHAPRRGGAPRSTAGTPVRPAWATGVPRARPAGTVDAVGAAGALASGIEDAPELPVGARLADEPAPDHGNGAARYELDGLPKRRRGDSLAEAQRGTDGSGTRTGTGTGAHTGTGRPPVARTPEEAGTRFGALRRAVQEGPSQAEPWVSGAPGASAAPADAVPPAVSPAPAPARPEDDAP